MQSIDIVQEAVHLKCVSRTIAYTLAESTEHRVTDDAVNLVGYLCMHLCLAFADRIVVVIVPL